ncbi:MAG: hypothetical protein KDB14_02380, partial [Planctomycetales bacterium]|nr:hypothetical protein [Planctomycetales bacterium]
QTMPEAVCVDTGQEVGYGTAPLERSPITGGTVKPWSLSFEDRQLRPREIHRLFYGRAHLVFGWSPADREHTLPWDHLPDYVALAMQDAIDLFGPGERQLAYLFGWLAHIVGDSLIKSIRPGVTLKLLDGTYTAANRPIQDLVTFHEVGRTELQLNWPALLDDLARAPVEPAQLHYMRVGRPRGLLAAQFPHAWTPRDEPLLHRVLAENRRYQLVRNPRLLKQYALTRTPNGWECDQELRRTAGGLSYADMVELARRADFRHALWQIGETTADLFEQVVQRMPALQEISTLDAPTWAELTARWKPR